METISILLQIIILLLFAVLCLGFISFPILFEADMKNKTGKGFLNQWLTGIEFICLIGCFDPSSDGFYGNSFGTKKEGARPVMILHIRPAISS